MAFKTILKLIESKQQTGKFRIRRTSDGEWIEVSDDDHRTNDEILIIGVCWFLDRNRDNEFFIVDDVGENVCQPNGDWRKLGMVASEIAGRRGKDLIAKHLTFRHTSEIHLIDCVGVEPISRVDDGLDFLPAVVCMECLNVHRMYGPCLRGMDGAYWSRDGASDPSQSEIREACDGIRESWSENVRRIALRDDWRSKGPKLMEFSLRVSQSPIGGRLDVRV